MTRHSGAREARTRNLEIPRCAIAHLRSGPSDHPGMTIQNTWSSNGNHLMALVLNEEQSMLRDSARGLISDKAPVSHLRQLRDSKDATGFSRDLWRSFAEM